MLRSGSPALVTQEHAAWIIAVELARAAARAAAGIAVPAGKGKRAGQVVHPREISFTASRRAVITSTRSGAATASLPAALTEASRDAILAGLARRRVDTGRNRHRDRKTKARPGFPAGGPHLPTRTAAAQISICGPLAPDPRPLPAPRSHRRTRRTWNRPQPGAASGAPHALTLREQPEPGSR